MKASAMISETEARELILDLFEEEALVLGGIAAVHGVQDDLIWRLILNLDVIRVKALRRLENRDPVEGEPSPARRPNLKPHPAIEDFLSKLRRGHP